MAVGTAAALAGGALLGSGALGGSKQSGAVTQTNAPWDVQQPYLQDLFRRSANTLHYGQYDGQTLSPGATSQLGDTISGKYLNPASNPFLGQYVNDALGLVRSNVAGQLGGPAGQNLGNSGYQENLTRTLANAALPMYAQAYDQERQNQLQATQMAAGMDNANRTSPFVPLQAYQQLIGGQGYGGSNTQPFFTNPMSGALGGALAGGQIFKMFGGK